MRPTLLAAALVLLPAACAHRPLAVVLSFGACPVTRTPDGRDLDDGGVDVAANVATDLAPAPRRLAVTHFPGGCETEVAVVGGLPSLTCSDPHLDVHYVLGWTRPSPRTLVLERREVAIPAGDVAPPAVHVPLAKLPIERATWIHVAPRTSCAAGSG
ncbi:MAG TPA: hypothetical protein VH853_13105 [Polyangia bacterium]|nr:hypothetical protein [Polyangia bacterium]